jgi:hypothetical protein
MEPKSDRFLTTKLTFAVVLRGDINSIEELKKFILSLGMTVVYQATSAGRLYISQSPPQEMRRRDQYGG